MIREVYATVDRAYEGIRLEGISKGVIPGCKPGCAACCSYAVQCFEAEARIIASSIQDKPRKIRQQYIDKLETWMDAFRLFGRMESGKVNDLHAFDTLLKRWQVGRVACPFLNSETHTCNIYPVRPTACRVHNAVGDNPVATEKPCTSCAVGEPGEGCFTRPEYLQHGHINVVYQMSKDLQDVGPAIWSKLGQSVGLLPDMVLHYGRQVFGWKRKDKLPLYIIETSVR